MRFHLRSYLGIKDDEKVISVTRKHFLSFIEQSYVYWILFFIFLVGFLYFLKEQAPLFFLYLLALGLLVSASLIMYVWTNHYLDLWIITNKRIIHIEQIKLFHRTKSVVKLDRIQNVSIKKSGFFQEMFDYGSINVETAGYKTFVTRMDFIPHPNRVSKQIMTLIDKIHSKSV